MVDVTGIEPVTPCLQRLVARRINKLHGMSPIATEPYKCILTLRLNAIRQHPVAKGRVWWWAQNWSILLAEGLSRSTQSAAEILRSCTLDAFRQVLSNLALRLGRGSNRSECELATGERKRTAPGGLS
jgi:hypothetical protein